MSHASLIVVSAEPTEPAIAEQMAPFDENGEWFADGSRWDWWQIGGRFNGELGGLNHLQVKDIDLEKLALHSRKELLGVYAEWSKDNRKDDPFIRQEIYGINEGETETDYVTRKLQPFPAAFAFLHKKCWHESGRMGWFGSTARTECEVKGKSVRRCVATSKDGTAKVYSWNESPEDWRPNFYDRFIKNLSGDLWLTLVDYHV